ncbi:MAG: class I SAM-dependent methyltransferase [Saprospiraceae bacterium]|nr:class I SAM-dependent methyltransferase [Saprospiraceae bacterium]
MRTATENRYIPALRFRWLTRWYDSLMAWIFPESDVHHALIESANIRPGQFILDFGTGTASFAIRLKQRHPLPELVGLDVDPDALKIAQQKIEKAGVYLELVEYDGEQLPYPDNTFDRVVTCLVLHHLNPMQKRRSLRELRRVLKENGSLHVADWGKPSNYMMRLAFYFVQLLDGFKTTKENVQGLLPKVFHESGFAMVTESGKVDTALGTMRIYSVFGTKSIDVHG